MGTLWNYFGFHQERTCSEENSLWKLGKMHVLPLQLWSLDRVAELEPQPLTQDNTQRSPFLWKTSEKCSGQHPQGFQPQHPSGLQRMLKYRVICGQKCSVSSGLGSNPSWFAPKPHTVSGLQLSQVLLKSSQTLVNLAWTLHWKGKSKRKLSSWRVCLQSFCPPPILMSYRKPVDFYSKQWSQTPFFIHIFPGFLACTDLSHLMGFTETMIFKMRMKILSCSNTVVYA